MNLIDNNYSYLFSSFETLPNNFFQGYCFVENDLIVGTEGAEQYHKEIPPFCDGCYVSLSREKDNYLIGTDSSGFKKIFLYNKDGVWAVSNSVFSLAKFLYKKGVALTKNYALLAWIMSNNGQADQPASLNTLFKEISLVPHEAYLSIKDNKVNIKSKSHIDDLGYEGNLNRFMEVWVSRIETLIIDDSIDVFTDITGGIDSRTLYALFIGALNRLGLEDSENFFLKSGTADKYKDDLLSATAIINRYKGKLNVKRSVVMSQNRGVDTYEKWRALSLGCYAPVYLPYRNTPNNIVYFGGGAGGMHRRVYNSKNLEEYIFRATKNISEKYDVSDEYNLEGLIEEYTSQAQSSLEEVKTHSYSKMNDMDVLYREYRNRFHAGRGPQNGTIIAPLGSEFLKAVSNYCSELTLQRKQIYYDIMESLCPGLSIMPYDVENKFPSHDVIKNISLVEIKKQSNPGKVYIERSSYKQTEKIKDSCYQALSIMKNEVLALTYSDYPKFFSTIYTNDALETLEQAIIKEGFTLPREASSIHAILSYKMMCDFSS